ncbi:hypothetical protein DITRI_Ditri13aG0006600 [Diplodiscus trichospermus]
MASVLFNGKPLPSDVLVDETWFSDSRSREETKKWYVVSKTLAKEAAWKFAKDNGIDLVTLHPGLCFGPPLPPILNSSLLLIPYLVKGTFCFNLFVYDLHCFKKRSILSKLDAIKK